MSSLRVPCLILLLILEMSSADDAPQVQTSLGWVRGAYTTTREGRKIVEFLGMPYAKPPVKDLRFKSPVEHDPWSGVRDATKQCEVCMQQFVLVESMRNLVTGSEDCLCINIYTPTINDKANMPVIFLVHGGAHMGMDPLKAIYGPENLLKADVILVTFGHRLGVLGFLTTGDEVIPGNFGMKDQALALRWVKKNIGQFGGDPNSITLMGESSGAGSVHLHMLSPLSRDLFQRAIIQSGSGLCPWGYSEPQVLAKQTATVASLVKCPETPSSALLACLQSLKAEQIVDTTRRFVKFDNDPVAFWNPVVEKATVKDAFLTQSPWKLTPRPIPLLAGIDYAEGGFKTFSILTGDVAGKFKRYNAEFNTLAPLSLLYDKTAPNPQTVTDAVRKYYFGSLTNPITPEMIPQITKMYGDAWFANGVMDTVERHPGPRYFYYFNLNRTAPNHLSLAQGIFGSNMYLGACHMDELMCLFPMNGTSPKPTDKSVDYSVSLAMVDLWTSFAKNSKPTSNGVSWEPVKTSALEYLHITNTGLKMEKDLLKERRQFWKTLKLRN